MNHWLMKSEPDVFSIRDLEKKKTSSWDGVRNYQARNLMRDEMKVGDLVLFYHSSVSPKGVAGIARVCREAHPDPTSWDPKSLYYDPKSTREAPRWFMVDVEFVERFPELVPLPELREKKGLEKMVLLNRSRLSVQPVTKKEFDLIVGMGRK